MPSTRPVCTIPLGPGPLVGFSRSGGNSSGGERRVHRCKEPRRALRPRGSIIGVRALCTTDGVEGSLEGAVARVWKCIRPRIDSRQSPARTVQLGKVLEARNDNPTLKMRTARGVCCGPQEAHIAGCSKGQRASARDAGDSRSLRTSVPGEACSARNSRQHRAALVHYSSCAKPHSGVASAALAGVASWRGSSLIVARRVRLPGRCCCTASLSGYVDPGVASFLPDIASTQRATTGIRLHAPWHSHLARPSLQLLGPAPRFM